MNLPWWDDMKHSQERDYWRTDNIWLNWNYELEAEERIREHPLTQELIQEFMRDHVETLDWSYHKFPLILSKTHIIPSAVPWKFKVYISRHVDEEERAEGLTHEFTHGIYRAGDEYQKLIQAETLKFYNDDNRFFMKTLLRKNLHPSIPPK